MSHDLVADYGGVGDGVTDNATAFANWIAAGSGNLLTIPAGVFLTSRSIDGRGISNCIIQGAGIGVSTVKCTAALDGTDPNTRNDVFNFDNLTGPYQSNITIQDLTIDATLQNPTNIPSGTTGGYNLCGIEYQNVHNASARRVYVLKAFGNGIVYGSINPLQSYAINNPIMEDCILDTCVNGVLPQYGITGSVIQVGAANGGHITGNTILNAGGPWMDAFNCLDTLFTDNYVSGINSTAITAGQSPGAFHSDFGLVGCTVRNKHVNAGPIILNGNMTPVFFNGMTPTPGPQWCDISGNTLSGIGSYPWASQPTLPSSGGTVTAHATLPTIILLTGGSGIVVKVGGVTQVLSGVSANAFAAQAGTTVQINYTTAPTWSWEVAPSAFLPHIRLMGGSSATVLGQTAYNKVDDNLSINAPADAFQTYDGYENSYRHNVITNCGYAFGGSSAFGSFDSASGVSGTGNKESMYADNQIIDTRTNKTLRWNYYDNSVNNVNNRFWNNRTEVTLNGTLFNYATSPLQLHIKGCWANPPASSLGNAQISASNVALTNPFPYDTTCYMSGAGVSAVAINGQQCWMTGGTFNLKWRDQITVTYSGAKPNMVWQIS